MKRVRNNRAFHADTGILQVTPRKNCCTIHNSAFGTGDMICTITEQQLNDSQYGFRAGRRTRDAICQLRIMVERCLEMQITLYICFIDYTKAFDRIQQHDMFFEILPKAGVPDKEINTIKIFTSRRKPQCAMKT